jgi:hypothetical protein
MQDFQLRKLLRFVFEDHLFLTERYKLLLVRCSKTLVIDVEALPNGMAQQSS